MRPVTTWYFERSRQPARANARRAGFTITEMLVALAISLIVMASLVELFARVSGGIDQSLGSMEVQQRLRNARNLLMDDLNRMTVNPAHPPLSSRVGQGFLEIREGATRDYFAYHATTIPGPSPTGTWAGDIDDQLHFTIYGTELPSTRLDELTSGSYVAGEPTAAQVIWWVDRDRRLLYRYVIPILPNHPAQNDATVVNLTNEDFFRGDGTTGRPPLNVSRRFDSTTGQGVFRSLTDLALPDNRNSIGEVTNPDRLSTEVVLDNVVGFDVRVWDPGAPLYGLTIGSESVVVDPGDAAFQNSSITSAPVGFGAFVDIGYGYTASVGDPPAPFGVTGDRYDTWSRDVDGDPANIEAVDGLDNDGSGGVDDPGERPTRPPYMAPLRALEVTIRVYDPESRAVKQMTIRKAFRK
ncbi:MAG: prepilin-type N-terminal cleavage/methylation domain-containing protein [Planctomycetota bacterium]|nr:MAG: prepilin-type N-terminal cleavage/methylation domain-containing protein [Planctomycetota bacterium]REK45932.1 MAG: prepilin-type N-terminal cleavage/methylation domain-containing protein [Planctomycetota bacterium]